MKKHIFGFALFTSIFMAFALTLGFFYSPVIRKIEIKKRAILKPDKNPYAALNIQNGISYRVFNSAYDLDSGEFTSNVHLMWMRSDKAPREVFVRTRLFNLESGEEALLEEEKVFTEPFGDFAGTTVTVRHKLIDNLLIDERKNLYVSYEISHDSATEKSRNLTEYSHVLFIHGEKSMNKK